jgi:hypothetical protein
MSWQDQGALAALVVVDINVQNGTINTRLEMAGTTGVDSTQVEAYFSFSVLSTSSSSATHHPFTFVSRSAAS